MPRREVSPPALPNVPFEALSPSAQTLAICWNLRLARKRAGLTMPAAVAHMRSKAPAEAVSLSYMGDIERGDRTPSLTTVLALARALDVAPEALFRRPDALTESAPEPAPPRPPRSAPRLDARAA